MEGSWEQDMQDPVFLDTKETCAVADTCRHGACLSDHVLLLVQDEAPADADHSACFLMGAQRSA